MNLLRKLNPGRTTLIFLLIVLAAAVLRLSYPADIEFKYDEHFMFERSQKIGVTEPWPALGMASGAGTRNPGMSIWIFVGLARLFSAADPVALARTIQLLGVGAVALLLLIAVRSPKEPDRETWIWTAALAAVNPFAVLFHRKIWAQCALPLLSTIFLIGWLRRDRLWGAFIWGLVGACLGQIHMSGFYFAGAFFLWTVLFSRYYKSPLRVHWAGWFLGSVIGAIPLAPWIQYLITSGELPRGLGWSSILTLSFWRFWVSDPFGLGLSYSLGIRQLYDFFRYPLLGETPTYLVGFAHLVVLACCGTLFLRAIRRFFVTRTLHWSGDTALALSAAMFGFGFLMTLSRVAIMRHYLIVSFPFEFYWIARMACNDGVRGRKILAILVGAELILSSFFLYYIHVNHGAVSGDYWVGYQFQQK